ncbi:MAG: RND transporter, partial [Phycisphaerae bacterium]
MTCSRRSANALRRFVRAILPLLFLPGAIIVGCASPEIGRSGPLVQRTTQEKLGKDVTYAATAAARRQVHDRVRALLAAPLTADSAVQIALLNNQRLQADLAMLGIAQADLVQAGLFKNP